MPISWMCKKQTSVSHSLTEAEIISLDAGSRMDGIPALDLWDFNKSKDQESQGNLSRITTLHMKNQNSTKHADLDLSAQNHVSSYVRFSQFGAMLYVFEDNEAVGGVEKLPFPQNLRISSWSYDMAGHAKKCVERYCELANKTTQQLYKVSTPCIDDHHFKEEETKSVG